MKVVAEKRNDGTYALQFESKTELHKRISKEQIEKLERNKIFVHRDSYNAGHTINLTLSKEVEQDVINTIMAWIK